MLSDIAGADMVVGVKQTRRCLRLGQAARVFLALDADPHLTEELARECLLQGVPVIAQYTMAQLGQAAGIQVGASALTVRRDPEQG